MLFVVQETVALIDDFPQRLEVSFGGVVELFLLDTGHVECRGQSDKKEAYHEVAVSFEFSFAHGV
jgi:hypothetical protein